MPDWARAAVQIAGIRDQLAPFEDIPFPGHSFTLSEARAVLAHALNAPVRIENFPWWSVTLMSPFWGLMREFRKMRYLFETSHSLGGDKFNALLPGFASTDLQTVLLAGLPPQVHPNEMVGTSGQPVVAQ